MVFYASLHFEADEDRGGGLLEPRCRAKNRSEICMFQNWPHSPSSVAELPDTQSCQITNVKENLGQISNLVGTLVSPVPPES